MNACISCNLDEGRFNVELDAQGECNYCRHWRANKPRLTDFPALQPLLLERLAKLRGHGKYDAIVGFSGGKDSTYVVNSLVQKHGLRVLALTFDNGFLTALARRNIARVVSTLGTDHAFYAPDWALHGVLYRAALAAYGDPCVACAIPLYFYSLKRALDEGIPLVVHGRSPYQIFRNYYPGSGDIFLELHESNYRPHSFEVLTSIYQRFDQQVRGWLTTMLPDEPRERESIYREFFMDVDKLQGSFAPDFVGLFQFEPYDETKIKQEMTSAVGYERPANDQLLGHGDCSIHDACAHVFRRIHRASAIQVEVAAMIRHGALARDEGVRLLSAANHQENARPDVAIETFLSAVGMDATQFESMVEALAQRRPTKFACH